MHEAGLIYGEALYGLATEDACAERVAQDLALVCRAAEEEPAYLPMLAEPSITKQERRALLDEAWREHLHPYTLNFLKLLCDNGLIMKLPACRKEFLRRYNRDRGILPVRAVSAAPLSLAQQARLAQVLQEKTGKTIELTLTVDPDVLGGIRLDMEGLQLDGTVRHHLDALQRLLQASSM